MVTYTCICNKWLHMPVTDGYVRIKKTCHIFQNTKQLRWPLTRQPTNQPYNHPDENSTTTPTVFILQDVSSLISECHVGHRVTCPCLPGLTCVGTGDFEFPQGEIGVCQRMHYGWWIKWREDNFSLRALWLKIENSLIIKFYFQTNNS